MTVFVVGVNKIAASFSGQLRSPPRPPTSAQNVRPDVIPACAGPPEGGRSEPLPSARLFQLGSEAKISQVRRSRGVEGRNNERSRKLGRDVVRRGGGGLLRQPGHLGDALRRGARPGRRRAVRARAVRGCCDGCGRRLRAHGGQASFDPSAPWARTRQRAGQRAQRQARQHADGQHRR